MSRTYSSWRSLRSPNIRSSSTSENPITALSGVRSSCDMLARNSDLCRLATSSWRLLLELAEHARVVDRDRRLARERLEQLRGPVREGAGGLAPDDQRAEDLLLPAAAEPRASSATAAGAARRGAGRAARARDPGPAAARRSSRRGRRTSRRRGCASPPARRPAPDSVPTQVRSWNRPRRRVELEDRAALGAGELRPRGSRSSSSTSSTSRLEQTAWLISPSARSSSTERSCTRAALEQLDVLDRDRRLRGERRQELDRPVVERIDLEPPERRARPTTRSPTSIGAPSIVR